ncbi:MAG: DNA gyrase C-terminal beta-propeller domain-containing protein, partial [Planctomycetota bacterium]
NVVALRRITEADDLMLITVNGMIVRINAGTVRQTKRASAGVRVISLASGDKLVGVARVKDEDNQDDTAAADNGTPPADGAEPTAE